MESSNQVKFLSMLGYKQPTSINVLIRGIYGAKNKEEIELIRNTFTGTAKRVRAMGWKIKTIYSRKKTNGRPRIIGYKMSHQDYITFQRYYGGDDPIIDETTDQDGRSYAGSRVKLLPPSISIIVGRRRLYERLRIKREIDQAKKERDVETEMQKLRRAAILRIETTKWNNKLEGNILAEEIMANIDRRDENDFRFIPTKTLNGLKAEEQEAI